MGQLEQDRLGIGEGEADAAARIVEAEAGEVGLGRGIDHKGARAEVFEPLDQVRHDLGIRAIGLDVGLAGALDDLPLLVFEFLQADLPGLSSETLDRGQASGGRTSRSAARVIVAPANFTKLVEGSPPPPVKILVIVCQFREYRREFRCWLESRFVESKGLAALVDVKGSTPP